MRTQSPQEQGSGQSLLIPRARSRPVTKEVLSKHIRGTTGHRKEPVPKEQPLSAQQAPPPHAVGTAKEPPSVTSWLTEYSLRR